MENLACSIVGVSTIGEKDSIDQRQDVLLPVNGQTLPLVKSQRVIFSQKSQRHQEHYLVIKPDTKVEVGKDPYCTSLLH